MSDLDSEEFLCCSKISTLKSPHEVCFEVEYQVPIITHKKCIVNIHKSDDNSSRDILVYEDSAVRENLTKAKLLHMVSELFPPSLECLPKSIQSSSEM